MRAAMSRPRRHLFVPEVVQTSAMDCGPAALTCLLAGHGLSVSYGRLREACQTDVDGTSIDMLETVAVQLGLHAEQILVPVDHLFLPETAALPAIVVVRQPSGATHFVVAWRRHGRVVQVMDPGTGRRWPTCRRFLDELYVHTQAVPATAWRAWAETDEFLGGLRRRWAALAIGGAEGERAPGRGAGGPGMGAPGGPGCDHAHAHGACARRRAPPGPASDAGVGDVFCPCLPGRSGQTSTVPAAYWMVRPAPPAVRTVRRPSWYAAPSWCASAGSRRLPLPRWSTTRFLAGRLRTALPGPGRGPGGPSQSAWTAPAAPAPRRWAADPDGAGAWRVPRGGRCAGRGAAVAGTRRPHPPSGPVEQRLGALVALLVFVSALLLLDLVNGLGLWRLGRRLEARLRLAFLAKIPRLGDRYFQSRPTSDMAERSHSLHRLRLLPGLGGQRIRVVAELVCTTAGLVWLDPSQALLVVLAVVGMPALLLAMQPLLTERDLRVRTHAGALGRFSLDALLGLTAVRTHGAERAMQREYESLLVEWTRAGLHLQRAVVSVEGVQGSPGLWLSPPGSWRPIWPTAARPMGRYY